MKIGQARLNVFIYQELIGILTKDNRDDMVKMLNRKERKGNLEPLERRIWSAYVLHPGKDRKSAKLRRKFIKTELNAWEKRAQ